MKPCSVSVGDWILCSYLIWMVSFKLQLPFPVILYCIQFGSVYSIQFGSVSEGDVMATSVKH